MAKYCPEIVDEICKNLEEGSPQKEASILAGINKDTFYDWKKNKSDFSDRVKKSLAIFQKKLIQRVNIASNDSWQAAAWTLERRFKDDYALRSEFTGKDGESLRPTIIDWTGKFNNANSKTETGEDNS